MADYIDIERARALPGLRLVVPPVPGPWAEGAKGLFHVKHIPVARVRQAAGEANEELVSWTGESNAPQAVFDDEPVRTGWTEMILLAERLAPEPPLLPRDPAQRALVFGLCHLLAGEEGFGWQRRHMMFHQILGLPVEVLAEDHPVRRMVARMGARYGYSEAAAEAAPERAADILRLFTARLEEQGRSGSRYLVGSGLTALDVYWAVFAALIEPLPADSCPMPEVMRNQYTLKDDVVGAAASPILLEHRDFVYEKHLELPIDL